MLVYHLKDKYKRFYLYFNLIFTKKLKFFIITKITNIYKYRNLFYLPIPCNEGPLFILSTSIDKYFHIIKKETKQTINFIVSIQKLLPITILKCFIQIHY